MYVYQLVQPRNLNAKPGFFVVMVTLHPLLPQVESLSSNAQPRPPVAKTTPSPTSPTAPPHSYAPPPPPPQSAHQRRKSAEAAKKKLELQKKTHELLQKQIQQQKVGCHSIIEWRWEGRGCTQDKLIISHNYYNFAFQLLISKLEKSGKHLSAEEKETIMKVQLRCDCV